MNLPLTQIRKTRGKYSQRRGTEVVELAIILPLLLILLFSTLEICEQAFLLQKVKIAAHEGAVVAIGRTATEADVEQAVQDYLEARGVNFGGDITTAVEVTPDPTKAATLTPVTVTVKVPYDDNSRIGAQFLKYIAGENSVGKVTMYKEYESDIQAP